MSTLYVYDRSNVSVTNLSGGAPRNGDVLGNAQNGNAFSWESPDNLAITFGGPQVALNFSDSDGRLSDSAYTNDRVTDQALSQPVSIAGRTFAPSSSTIQWQDPPPVTVEDSYHVTLFDVAHHAYTMVVVSITQGYSSQIVGITFDGAEPPPGTTLYYDQAASTYTGTGQSIAIPSGVATCFLAGTPIDTPLGPRAIETLAPGDLVLTWDGDARPIRRIERRHLHGLGLDAPVEIAAGVLGNRGAVIVSPNHRVMVASAHVALWFGVDAVLIAAKFLVDGHCIRRSPRPVAHYCHLELDGHALLCSDGLVSESLLPRDARIARTSLRCLTGREARALRMTRDFAPPMRTPSRGPDAAAADALRRDSDRRAA